MDVVAKKHSQHTTRGSQGQGFDDVSNTAHSSIGNHGNIKLLGISGDVVYSRALRSSHGHD